MVDNNIFPSRELSSAYDFKGYTNDEVWARISQAINIMKEHINYVDNKVDIVNKKLEDINNRLKLLEDNQPIE